VAQIFIENLRVECVIGVHDFERRSRQRLSISVTMTTDLERAAASDDLAATVDYAAVAEQIEALAIGGEFKLVETLAERIAAMLIGGYPLSAVDVEIRKPAAVRRAEAVGVRIRRSAP
jgi:dihydroneopterin aldolase